MATTATPTTPTTPEVARYCASCGRAVDAFLPGPGGKRPDAACPRCGSLERHRFLSVLLDGMAPYLATARVVLDIAPSKQTVAHLRRHVQGHYLRVDFDPSADRRAVDVQASVTDLPLPDRSVDLLLCFHVLEHVPDDRAAMRELSRVLAGGGVGFVQVPWRPHTETDEDPAAPEEERVRRFGQADHVRYYGRDFEDRLRAEGLDPVRLTPRAVLSPDLVRRWGLLPDEVVWLVRPAEAGARAPLGDAVLPEGAGRPTALVALGDYAARHPGLRSDLDRAKSRFEGAVERLEAVRGEVVDLTARLREAEARARRAEKRAGKWERAYRELAAQPPIRLARALRRRVARVVSR
ncbi:class I SAM-dependent methyltransferase [Vallicoccus soli]|uniref:Class I SAM-dependent methyltransferase n=1 Tax=Vallicoccus soli TaxID=2339232 RepID=A0A3A3YX01_9ACTN|nr:class I SAM-dependent methyltransferase [Vallicoccus soli]RJK95315.1 class I SAM-dependent methyltransferase [Vallicoccus soli]